MTELVPRQATDLQLDSKIRFAQALADASLLPQSYRRQPANVLLAMEMGEALGVSTIQAINGIHVIEGKPTASVDLMVALVRRAGHKVRFEIDEDQLVATCTVIRSDDPEFPYVARWDMDKARDAELLVEDPKTHKPKKDNWRKYPISMLRSRAGSEAIKMGASDVLYGMVYTPEELGAEVGADGTPIITQVPEPAIDNLGPAGYPDQNADESDADYHERKRRRMFALFGEVGLGTREEQVAWIEDVLDRELGSRANMMTDDYLKVIGSLEAELATQQQPEPDQAFVNTDTGEVQGEDPWATPNDES